MDVLLFIALLVERIVEYLFESGVKKFVLDDELRKWVLQIISGLVGVVLAYCFDVRLMYMLFEVSAVHPLVDNMVSGFAVAGGAEALHQLFSYANLQVKISKSEQQIRQKSAGE
jgi:hypothetical protein